MKALALLLLLAAAPATDFKYLGTLNASSGASTNNAAAACTKADGTTAAIGAFSATGTRPLRIAVQCDVPVRLRTSNSSSAIAAITGANKGIKLDVEQLLFIDLTVGYLAEIPASGSGAAACDIYQRIGE